MIWYRNKSHYFLFCRIHIHNIFRSWKGYNPYSKRDIHQGSRDIKPFYLSLETLS